MTQLSMETDTTLECCRKVFPNLSCEQFNAAIALANTLNKTIVVEFGAEWCGPCKKMRPLVHELIKNYENVELFYINIDDEDWVDLVDSHGVESIPHTDIINPLMPFMSNEPIIGANLEKLKKSLDSIVTNGENPDNSLTNSELQPEEPNKVHDDSNNN